MLAPLVRDDSGEKVLAGSVWIGRHCMYSELSLDSFKKMLSGSVVKLLD